MNRAQRDLQHRELEEVVGLRLPSGYGDCRKHYRRVVGAQCSCGALEASQLTDRELDLLGAAIAQHLLEYAGYRDRHRTGEQQLCAVMEQASHGYVPGQEFARALNQKLGELGYRVEKIL